MTSKLCCKCKLLKPLTDFGKLKKTKDGLRYDCNDCRKEYNQSTKERRTQYNKEYFQRNKEELSVKNAEYRLNNEDSIRAQRKQYREANADHIKEKQKEYLPIRKQRIKERRKVDKDFQLTEILRSKIHKMLKGNETSYKDLIGCEHDTLKKWLEFQFDDKMSWDNIGTYWHVDHILPINKFDLSNELDKRVCFRWTNLQPLEGKENRSKYNHLQLQHYFNSIITIHRFIQMYKLDSSGYQSINESRCWLREKLRYGKNPTDVTMGNPQPSS